MERRNGFRPSNTLLPALNTGGMWDIVTGTFLKGKHGEMILNGGLSYLTGIAGQGNTYKSAMLWDMILSVMDNTVGTEAIFYDTEISARSTRPQQLAWQFERLMKETPDLVHHEHANPDGPLTMTNGVDYMGEEWYSVMYDTMISKHADYKKEEGRKNRSIRLHTPFVDQTGEYIEAIRPDLYGIDSISGFTTSAVEQIQKEHDLNSSKRNMEVMRGGMGKTQMLMELPVLTGRGGGYMIMTAHVGKAFQLDPNQPLKPQLAFMAQDLKFKNTPEKFSFYMNNCWVTLRASKYFKGTGAADRVPMYPRDGEDTLKDDTDLMTILVVNLRGKSGGSGLPFELVVSQSEGVLHGLSQLDYLKQYGRFGLGGDNTNYYLELRPEEKISRTKVRGKLNACWKLRRAMHIQYEMCFMRNCWHHIGEEYLEITPSQLYEGLKAKGYDWEVLLDTDHRWKFNELRRPEDRPFLSTMDLLNMYLDRYHPYWMKDKPVPAGKSK